MVFRDSNWGDIFAGWASFSLERVEREEVSES